MIKREFDDEKIQEIYNTEYAKELAKIDAGKVKRKLSVYELILICVLAAILIYLWLPFLFT